MSIQAVSIVLDSTIADPAAKLVMISLANALNGITGQCNPSISQICKEASTSRSTVIRKLQWLAEQGWIEIVPDYDHQTGRQRSNAYRLNLDSLPREGVTLTPGGGCQDDTGEGVTGDMGEGVSCDTPLKKPEYKPEEDPLSETGVPDTPKPVRKRKAYPDAFERAWSSYPTDQNMSKLDAFKAWSKLDVEDRAKVEAGIPGFVAYCRKNPDYRPVHMVRFITGRRFDGFAENTSNAYAPEVWAKRLAYARKNKSWATGQWGPMPGVEGCRVPANMLEPQDGVGWAYWDAKK